MTTHFRILAWKIPWTEKPDGLYSTRGRKEQDMAEHTHTHIYFLSLLNVLQYCFCFVLLLLLLLLFGHVAPQAVSSVLEGEALTSVPPERSLSLLNAKVKV